MKKDLIIVIFGSTGDLTARKLLPAITALYKSDNITKNIQIIALGRRDFDTTRYLEFIQKQTTKTLDFNVLKDILTYYKIEITEQQDYIDLQQYIEPMLKKDTKEIYYMAIGPEILKNVAKNVSMSKLIEYQNPNQVLVFEKPFGHDLDSAMAVNEMLWHYFDESQIFRIDHYLGKEMIQNLMTVRFANRILKDTWDSKSIQSIRIHVKEKEGILSRAGYYDTSGALKDMVQSHLLQILSLVAMDPPKKYHSDYIKDEKVKVLRSLEIDKDSVVFGQYKGYLDEENIPSDSKTDTFVYFKVYVNTPRFRGIPFEIMTGKKLSQKASYIEIQYYPTAEQEQWHLDILPNKLTIHIQPNDGVELKINSKKPGLKESLEEVSLTFNTSASVEGNIPEAYEKLILDIVMGHRTLFTRWDEIDASWHFIDRIKKCKHDLVIYEDEKDIFKHIKK